MRLACLLLFATTALAHTTIQRVPMQRPQSEPAAAAQIDDVTTLKLNVTRLRGEMDALRRQVEQLSAAVRDLQASAPRCEGVVSRGRSGARDCSPFACDAATGSCISSCNNSKDCNGAAGFRCNAGNGRCERAP